MSGGRCARRGRSAARPAERRALRAALLALLIAALALLCGCGYLAVEEAPIRVGDAIVAVTPQPRE